jgi:Na+/glutamate symporter
LGSLSLSLFLSLSLSSSKLSSLSFSKYPVGITLVNADISFT